MGKCKDFVYLYGRRHGGRESFVLTTRSHQQAPFTGKALHVLAYLHVMLSTPLVSRRSMAANRANTDSVG